MLRETKRSGLSFHFEYQGEGNQARCLHTWGDGEIYERQQQMEQDRLGTVALPYYAVFDANDQLVAGFPGLTRNSAEFVDFLKKAQENK